ncbi:MAG: AMP-binding protein [Candidatus Puniceispirillaceae bacterium]
MSFSYSTDKYDKFEKQSANYVPLTPLSFLPRTALMFGDKPSVIYGTRHYTWSQTYDRCRQLASALTKAGIEKHDTVAVMAANTPELVECHFGVAMAGGVLNTINVRLDAQTIAYILNHGEAKFLITDTGFSATVKQALSDIGRDDITVIDIIDDQADGNGETLGSLDYEGFLATGDADFDWQMPHDEWDPLSLNYTSGTSGKPKGVVYHHRGSYLMSMGTVTDWNLPRHPNYLYTVPMFHCNGWGHAWTMTALAGTIICIRTITAEVIYDLLHKHNITHFGGAPIVLGMIVNADDSARKPLSHQVEVMTAGAPPPAAILEAVQALGFNVTQVYGLTETYGHTIMCSWNSDWDDLDFSEKATIKARQGAAMVHTDSLRIVSLETGQDVPADGETMGEIWIRGNTIMKGYLKDPDATAATLSDGWLRSGDLGVMHPGGYMEVKDRLKDIIISGGENISSVEIESVLHRHPAVALAAVVAKKDEKWGEVPCAFVELKDGMTATEDEIIAFARGHLAGFKRPKHVVFGTLPKTATGKIQKFELRNS